MWYYKSLDIYLNTSLHEGIPMSVLEAMACGVPVVAAKVGGLAEIIADGRDGFLVESRNPEDYARRCADLIGDMNLRQSVRESAVRRVESDFSAGRMTRDYTSLYLSLLGYQSYVS
jgi:glycosyltransferase involved in cell wall biosynthesis